MRLFAEPAGNLDRVNAGLPPFSFSVGREPGSGGHAMLGSPPLVVYK
ncbi:MAG TPA: hypothetical protein VKG24_20310 [Pseudolabrys sp.]|nr:hypothetical protein [Pseudolabrys sp.]